MNDLLWDLQVNSPFEVNTGLHNTRLVQHKNLSITSMRVFPQGVQPYASGGLWECLWFWWECMCVPVSCCCSSGLSKQIVYGESDHCCSSESPVILECPEEWRSKHVRERWEGNWKMNIRCNVMCVGRLHS